MSCISIPVCLKLGMTAERCVRVEWREVEWSGVVWSGGKWRRVVWHLGPWARLGDDGTAQAHNHISININLI